nr:PREDICTED: centromere protein F [Megachile rotundata]
MAFSLHMGTKWCHDFPKLARESGFYFNRHKSKVRIDWNRISSIDINQIIRDRDFYTIDDNINNVIDYCLESEYDVKILDPNFVKIFHLAQLAVEYLLYCKQYLDHSVIILKDELRSKIEENVKLKKEVTTLEETIKSLKEKTKERNRLIETKLGDSNGEIYRCPHCPKSFISSMFVSAHIIRRHAYASDSYMPASPMHEHYRSETEKLHNEIKNLKERLNETEKVIRNESEKISDQRLVEYDKKQPVQEADNLKNSTNKFDEYQGYKGYQEEIKNLKTMLFDEIHNLRQKEKTVYEHNAETNVQTLISQQEKEFQKLKNQLFEKLNPDIESVHAKLHAQENYWKSKIQQLENQHHKDVEKLAMELKLTQKIADNMKAEYESKVSNLERQAANQSNILTEQSKQLHSLSNEINVSQLHEKSNDSENNLPKKYDQSIILNQPNETKKKPNEIDFKKKAFLDAKIHQVDVGNISSLISSSPISKEILLVSENKLPKNVHTLKSRTQTIMCENKKSIKAENTEDIKKGKFYNENKTRDTSESEDSILETEYDYEVKRKEQDSELVRKPNINERNIHKQGSSSGRNISQDILSHVKNNEKFKIPPDNLSSATNSESYTSDSHTLSESESITTIHNNYPLHKHTTHTLISSKPKKVVEHDSLSKKLGINLRDVFEQKLRDLGIDPEWQGIPKATFKQKMDILKHHEKIAAKKLPNYPQVKLKIIKEIIRKISKKEKAIENFKYSKKSPSHTFTTNVKQTAVKAAGDNKYLGHASTLQDKISNNINSTLESEDSLQSTIDSESPIKPAKPPSIKNTERLVGVSPNLTKSLKNVHHVMSFQESPIQKSSFSKIKQLNATLYDKDVLNSTSMENNSVNHSNVEQELQNVPASPKHNKSVLKSTTGSTSSLMKKKVIFDLRNEKDKESVSDYDIKKEESFSEYDARRDELNDSNWNTPSDFDEQRHHTVKEAYKQSDNIILRTAQSDKIAEISRKLEAQLNMVRQKPVGSVETIFSSTFKQSKENREKDIEHISGTSINSFLESSFKTSNSKLIDDSGPSSRSVNHKISETLYAESVSDVSDLDSDIDKILKLE